MVGHKIKTARVDSQICDVIGMPYKIIHFARTCLHVFTERGEKMVAEIVDLAVVLNLPRKYYLQ